MEKSKIEIKYLCPLIGMISSGKTTLLKVLFDIDFLESSAGIGTKFVNIIRYNPNVGNLPKFYHLKVKNIGFGNYDFYKEKNTEIIGKENIKKKNKELNEKFKQKDIPYEDLFYMVEIGESIFIEDKEYLKNYDLVDIPGLNEYKPTTKFPNKNYSKKYSSIEEEMKNYNPENEQNYLTEIFKIIKNKVNNGIILFNIDNYQHTENYRIIGKLRKILDKPIENFLILLNKIDKSENIHYDLNNLRGKIMEYFPSAKDFNFIKNTILPSSTLQLENEFKMDKNFKNLIYYHYLNFVIKSKQSKLANNNITFIDFLKKLISRRKITNNNLIKKINEIIENKNFIIILNEIKNIINFIKLEHLDENLILGVRDDDFNEKEIKEIIENLGEDNDENEDFNINEQEGNIIILFYYSEFKNKKQIPPRSRDTLEIINFFSLNQNKFNFDINKIIDYIFNIKLYDYIYIPLFGVSNAGKSTVLNCIMGCDLLPCHRNECTKKGVIIKYWNKDFPVIRKTNLKKLKKIHQKYIYCFRPDEKIIAKGIEDIKKILEGANEKFLEDEEDYFYEINIKMKMIYESNMDDSLKEKICFIDLPGFGTNNEFEKKNIYSKLNYSFGNFIFVIYNLKIKENDNQKMLNNLYETIPKDIFINNCLFIINSNKEQDISEKSILQAKKDIIQIIPGLNSTNLNNINVCFFNAKYYENFLFKLNYYSSCELLIEYEHDQFINSNENFWKGFEVKQIKGVTFNKYLKEKLKDNIKNDISDTYNEKLIQSNEIYEKEIKQISDKNNYSFKDKDIEQIAKYISFAKNNINKSILLSNSNINIFEEKLINWIKNIKKKENEDINENMYIEIKGTKNIPKGTSINIFTYGKDKFSNYIDESKKYIKNKCVTISFEIGLSYKLTQAEKIKNINDFLDLFNSLLKYNGHIYLRKINYQNAIFDYVKEITNSKYTKEYFNIAFLKLYKPFSLNLKTDFNFYDLIRCTPEEIILKLITCILIVEGDDTYSKELLDSFFHSKFFTTIFKSALSYFFNLKLEYNANDICKTSFYKDLTRLLSSIHKSFNELNYISGWLRIFFSILCIDDSKEKIIYDLFGTNLFNNIKIWLSIPDYKIGLFFNMNNINSNSFFEELIERRRKYSDDSCNII